MDRGATERQQLIPWFHFPFCLSLYCGQAKRDRTARRHDRTHSLRGLRRAGYRQAGGLDARVGVMEQDQPQPAPGADVRRQKR